MSHAPRLRLRLTVVVRVVVLPEFDAFHRTIKLDMLQEHPCTDTKGQLVVRWRTIPSSRRLVQPDLSAPGRLARSQSCSGAALAVHSQFSVAAQLSI